MSNIIAKAEVIASGITAEDRLKRHDWLIVGEALSLIGAGLKTKARAAALKDSPLNRIQRAVRAAAEWVYLNWASVEPYTQPGQPLAAIHHPLRLRTAFLALNREEPAPLEVEREAAPADILPAPTTPDTLAAFTGKLAAAHGISPAEAGRWLQGLLLDGQGAPLTRREFQTAEQAADWLTAAAQWRNVGGKSVTFRAAKLRKELGSEGFAAALPSMVVRLRTGGWGVSLAKVEEQEAARLANRKALAAVKQRTVLTNDAMPSPDGLCKAMAIVNDDDGLRAKGLLGGTLWFQHGNGPVEVESIAQPLSFFDGWTNHGTSRRLDNPRLRTAYFGPQAAGQVPAARISTTRNLASPVMQKHT